MNVSIVIPGPRSGTRNPVEGNGIPANAGMTTWIPGSGLTASPGMTHLLLADFCC